jgi:tetratricopeptide (TPR) repeat protein
MPAPWRWLQSFWLALSCPAAQAQTQAETRQQVLYLEAGRLPDAMAMGEKAVSRWPDDPEIRHWLGLAYFKSGQLQPAREQLERARDLNKQEPGARFDLALVCLSQQDYAAAADELQDVVKLTPSNPLAHVLLGRSYLNSNRSLPAIDEFKMALRLDRPFASATLPGFAYAGRAKQWVIAEYRMELQRLRASGVVYELGHSLLEAGEHEEAVGICSVRG